MGKMYINKWIVRVKTYLFGILLIVGFINEGFAQEKTEIKSSLDGLLNLNYAVSFHLTDSVSPFKNATINLSSEDAWLYLDNIRPSEVLKRFGQSVLINGKPLQVGKEGNSRIAIFKQGTVIIPHGDDYRPLGTFTEKSYGGKSVYYSLATYYTNKGSANIPTTMVQPLEQDNHIRSFKLKKGYMATFSTASDGIGYSRVFIADTADVLFSSMPVELDQNISFIRVFPWQWPSKKGWCGGRGGIVQSNGENRQDNEINLTQSTWFYSWGGSDPANLNAEFVPMKWGTGGKMDAINSRSDVTHLLGHNEPNRPDQSNISVEKSLEDWPQLMQSGLRLGSPSVSDNSRLEDWLYKFIDEADKRNYRVDYVAVHAYWSSIQMPDAMAWYRQLKDIYLHTGRPIWITEWNNGANWTKEAWPSERPEQFAKQTRELGNIIRMLDTASFIERYSIYNWVEEKRAMVIDSITYKETNGKKVKDQLIQQTLTPAGVRYKEDKPTLAFNKNNEVIPRFSMNIVPLLTYTLTENKQFKLNWTVGAGQEMIQQYVVERSENKRPFLQVAVKSPVEDNSYTEPLMDMGQSLGDNVLFRVKVIGKEGREDAISNTVAYGILTNKNNETYIGSLNSLNRWSLFQFTKPYLSTPFLLFGTPTNRNKIPLTHRVKNLISSSFEFKFSTWQYLKNPNFLGSDTIAYLLLPKTGLYNWGGITALSATLNDVKESWTSVHFEKPFKVVPVIFASQISSSDDATTSVRIRNVTKEGFEIILQYEAAYAPFNVQESVNYLALTPGKGVINGRKIEVGITEDNTVGDFFGYKKIEFSSTQKQPAFFGFMQTESDGIGAALRIKAAGNGFAELFKEKELSKGSKPLLKEKVGWMVIE